MNAKYLALCGALSLAAFGCQGEFQSGDDGPGTPGVDAGQVVPEADASTEPSDIGTAQALFQNNVVPIIGSACNPGGACHASQDPAFIAADPNGAYTTINIHRDRLYSGFDAAASRLLINGEGGHYGAVYTDDDVEAIEAWLAQEKLDAEAGGGGQTISALQEWSGCMNLEDWEEQNVASLWANKNAENQGDCDACHNLAGDGFMASENSLLVFETITTNPNLMPSYFTQSTDGTSVVINAARFQKVGSQLSPHENHGAFNVEGGAMDALRNFYDLTVQRKLDGLCEPPRF
tara:strand:+ start:108463 stop:109335 length:873 start_codon:yes stop_codon:yes gene_type:complete